MGPWFLRSGARVRPASDRQHPLLRVLSSVLFAFLAFGFAARSVSPVTAQDSSPVVISVVEEAYKGSWYPTVGCWTVVFTSAYDPTVQYIDYDVCTDDVNTYVQTDPIPHGEYWIEMIDPNGYYTITLDPNYHDGSSAFLLGGGLYVWFIATIPGYTPPGTEVTVESDAGATITFDNVFTSGITTVAVTETAPTLPDGYLQVGGLYYEVSTTAKFDSATLCFSYDPTTVDGSTLSLLHYENGVWIDVTTFNDGAGTICGAVTSFSPFALVTQSLPTWTMAGFHAPVTMTADTFNTVQGGSAVPLKFNVYQDGIEVTDPAAVWVSITQIGCPGGVTDPVDEALVTETGTALHYAGTAGVDGQFIQKWKTEKVAVITCYQVTAGVADGSVAVTALFQLNP
jgi:hypothetical protein